MSETIGAANLGNARLRELTPEQRADKDQLIRFTGRTLRLGVNKGEEFRGYLEDIAVKVKPTDFSLYEVGNLIGGPFLSVAQTKLALEVFRGYLPFEKYSEAEEYINNALVRRGEKVIKLPPLPKVAESASVLPATPAVVASPVTAQVIERPAVEAKFPPAEPAFTEVLTDVQHFNAKHTQIEIRNNPDLQKQELHLWDKVNRLIYAAELRDIDPSILSELSDSARYTILSVVRDEGEGVSTEWRAALQDEQERDRKINNMFLNRYSQMRLLDCANRLQQILPEDPLAPIGVPALDAEGNRLLRAVSLITNRGIDSHTVGRIMARYPQNVRRAVGTTIIASNLTTRYSEAIKEFKQRHERNPQGTVRDNLVYIAGVYDRAGGVEGLMRGDDGTAGLRNVIADMRKEIQFLMPQIDPAELGGLVASIDNEAARHDASILYRGLGLDESQYRLYEQTLGNELRTVDSMDFRQLDKLVGEKMHVVSDGSSYAEKLEIWDLLQIAKAKAKFENETMRVARLEKNLEIYKNFPLPGKNYHYYLDWNSTKAEVGSIEIGARGVPENFRTLRIGQDEYINIGKLGQGIYADVYVFRSPSGVDLAVKALRSDAEERERQEFDEEAETMRRLYMYQHDHGYFVDGVPLTPKIKMSGTTPSGERVIVMDLATGAPLDKIMSYVKWGYPVISPSEALTITSQFCQVLEALHEGLQKSFDDFHSSELFWDYDKQKITIVDWNILGPRVKVTGEYVPATPEKDLQLAASILSFLFTGYWSKQEDNMQEKLAKLPQIPGLREIISKAFDQNPDNRYKSAKELSLALQEVSKEISKPKLSEPATNGVTTEPASTETREDSSAPAEVLLESKDFNSLLDEGAERLKNEGSFTAELSQSEVEQLMRQVVSQMDEKMQERGVSAQINELNVQIEKGEGRVEADIAASKKVAFVWVPADITAKFGLINELDDNKQPTGRLLTRRLEVEPESLYGVVNPKEFLNPHIGEDRINDTFLKVLNSQMQTRGAKVDSLSLVFTPGNKLRIRALGSKS